MQEILSIYYKCFDGMSCMVAFCEPKLLNCLVKISCNLATTELEYTDCLDTIISNLNLSAKDKDVLRDLIDSFLGDMSQYY
jgi:hypothetical protein